MNNTYTAKTIVNCGICGKQLTILGLGRHIKNHDIDKKSYYDTFMRKLDEGHCVICGKPTRFIKFTKGYSRFCSKSCEFEYNKPQMLDTMQKRYGVEYAAQSAELREKIRQTNLRTKGVDWAFHTEIGKQHAKETSKNKTKWLESYTKTCYDKYGVEYWSQTDDAKLILSQSCIFRNKDTIVKAHSPKANEKRRQTLLSKYGVDHPLKLESAQQNKNSAEARRKAWKTAHANGNSSSVEDKFEAKLNELGYIKDKDYFREYKSSVYPFSCDFYIPKKDLYIELNIHWTHGYHVYDESNEQDIRQLRKWQSKDSAFYKKAIEVWTIKDPLKFKTAKDNNLNYVVLWNTDDIAQFLTTFVQL